jgi:hypothetical protein
MPVVKEAGFPGNISVEPFALWNPDTFINVIISPDSMVMLAGVN